MPIPVDLIETTNRLIRMSQRMLVENGHEPTAEELAERLKIPMERVKRLLEIARRPVAL